MYIYYTLIFNKITYSLLNIFVHEILTLTKKKHILLSFNFTKYIYHRVHT